MDWITVDEARTRQGLRMVLAKGSWGAWTECAKNILRVAAVPYAAAPQTPFAENRELVAWTGVRNNPAAVYNDEPARTNWLDILNLVERLSPDPGLLPKDPAQRALVVGLSNELCGENGLAWCRRIELGAKSVSTGLRDEIMKKEYQAKEGDVSAEESRQAEILRSLAQILTAQAAAGSRYFVGDRISAIDVYWATISNLVGPLPEDVNPMAGPLRDKFSNLAPTITAALAPILFAHRDHVYKTYLQLPISFD